MLTVEPPAAKRLPKTVEFDADLVVVGGGLAGVCAAITAARQGLKVVLLQDRPVLGGNASSEVRLWVLGATAHMHSTNRWAREPGVINEILVENFYRNPDGNPLVFDTIVLEWVTREPNLTLLLNTAVFDCDKDSKDADRITQVRAFCSQNSTMYVARAPLFCDASGDGILAFISGAAFRVGAESRDEFNEPFAPAEGFGSLLGHSMYFYTKTAPHPVTFVPPSYALTIEELEKKIPRYRHFSPKDDGCRLWWIEFGGRRDTVHDTEEIKWELWRVIYGVWNYFKNSGRFPETANMTLEWASQIPGKRESRRFEGDYLLRQQDVIEATPHEDDVAFGGWALDLHPADGVYSPLPGCTHWRGKGIYPIPYRCLYSRNIRNLFLAGRIMSVTHAAFGSSRVIGTLSCCSQAVGVAAAICRQTGAEPRALASGDGLEKLRLELLRTGQFVPGRALADPEDLAQKAEISASSTLALSTLPADAEPLTLDRSAAQMLPVAPGCMPRCSVTVDVSEPTTLRCELRLSTRVRAYTPDTTAAVIEKELKAGAGQTLMLDFGTTIDELRYAFVCLMANPKVRVHRTRWHVTGTMLVRYDYTQNPKPDTLPDGTLTHESQDLGVETFEIWAPARRPAPQNLALTLDPPVRLFEPANVTNGLTRPTCGPNAWVAALDDPKPALTLRWKEPVTLGRVVLTFDPDWDHPVESVLMGHADNVSPFAVKSFRLLDGAGKTVYTRADTHQPRHEIRFDAPVRTDRLTLAVDAMHGRAPAAVFEVRCYAR